MGSSFALNLASAQETNNYVFFMKTNSTAKIYTEFIFPVVNNASWTLPTSTKVYEYPEINGGGAQVDSIPVTVEPNSFMVSQHDVNVTYAITAKNDTKGTFEIYTGVCGFFYPLVVGLNESEVDPKIFYSFYKGMYFCPNYRTPPPTVNLVGYSGLVSKTFSENSSTWGNPAQSPAVPEFPFAILILIISIGSLIVFYRIKFIK